MGVPIFSLTNWSAETWRHAIESYGFLRWFDGPVVSGQERTRKPSARAFGILTQRYGLRADKTLFIDDTEENVLAARGLGFVGIHFRSPAQLSAELSEFGLL